MKTAPIGIVALASVGIALSACETSTPYAPAEDRQGYGFTEQQIEDNRFRITFRGNSLTDRETVEDYLLFRAAEVTLEQGYDYFVVVEDDTEKTTTYTGVGPRSGFAYYGRGRPFPYYGYGYRWGPGYDADYVTERNRYSALAYIVMYKGEKPSDRPTAYDARQVVENLEPRIIRPEA